MSKGDCHPNLLFLITTSSNADTLGRSPLQQHCMLDLFHRHSPQVGNLDNPITPRIRLPRGEATYR